MSELNTNAIKRTPWLRRLSAPVRVLVEERIRQDGYGDDPDGWIADLLTTARRSPQGHVLRISATKPQVAALAKAAVEETDLFSAKMNWRALMARPPKAAVEETDLFSASGGGDPVPPELIRS